ncbi:hypothetical protein LTR53_001545 [Teratosphaeriaceae sp. CCFEE 6253]|nr:hypothetical protein LTR53_001545 [Teratosphaeriaceae sp. CCFEE 6253]
MALSVPSAAYPSPPSFPSSRGHPLSRPRRDGMMGGNTTNVDGRALDIARNTEGDLDPHVREYLERALTDIWGRIQQQPDTYILAKDEFAVFNFYIRRFESRPESEAAIARYWQHAQDPLRS